MKENKTIKGMMIKSVIIFCLIPFFLLWLSFAVSSGIELKKNIESEQRTIVRLLGISVDNYFYEIEEAMGKVSSDNKVQDILKTVDRNKYDSQLYNADQYILKMIGKTCLSFTGVENIIVANMEGGYYSTGIVENFMLDYIQNTEKLKEEIYNHQGRTWITAAHSENNASSLVLVKPVMDLENAEFIGMMYFVINKSEMDSLLKKSLDKQEAIFLLDDTGGCIYSENEMLMNEAGMVVTKSEVNSYGATVVTGVSVLQYGRQLLLRQLLLLFLFAGATVMVFILIQYIYQKINGQISGLLHPEEEGKIQDTTYFEIRQINHQMMTLMQKNDEGEKRIVKLVNHCETMTLDKLQAQINPHFLYNTLTSIKYIALENEQKQISDLITALVKLLRSTINREVFFIPLARELENVRNYICIQNAVYKGNVDFRIEIPEKLLDYRVPNFILQPLVENCIFHGIHPEEKGGEICISSYVTQKGLILTVKDNGDGFPEDCLMNMMGAENNKEMMTNFGLKGVQQKIQIACGEEYGIFVTSTKNEGATVEITLPLILEEGDKDSAEGYDSR